MPRGSKKDAYDILIKNQKDVKEQSSIQNHHTDPRIVLPDIHGAYLSASATVEAALVIPVFVYAVMAVMYIMNMILVQIRVQESLYNEIRGIAKYAYFYDCLDKKINQDGDLGGTDKEYAAWFQKGMSAAAVQALFINEIGPEYANKAGIVGGNAGFVMLGSEVMDGDNDISLDITYVVKNPFDIFGIALKKFTQHAEASAWIGNDECKGVEGGRDFREEEEKEYVYITANGRVYHTERTCTYLAPSVSRIRYEDVQYRRNESGGRYYECEYCSKKMVGDGSIYITAYGDRWHITDKCPKINRSIIKVLRSSVSDMRKCSKCNKDGR